MIKVNIVYDDIFDDVDIIAVPDDIFNNIKDIADTFQKWEGPKDDRDYWTVLKNGRACKVVETTGFIKWLNNNYCTGDEKAIIVTQHTNYCPEYESIEF